MYWQTLKFPHYPEELYVWMQMSVELYIKQTFPYLLTCTRSVFLSDSGCVWIEPVNALWIHIVLTFLSSRLRHHWMAQVSLMLYLDSTPRLKPNRASPVGKDVCHTHSSALGCKRASPDNVWTWSCGYFPDFICEIIICLWGGNNHWLVAQGAGRKEEKWNSW